MGKRKKTFRSDFANRQRLVRAADDRIAQAIRFASLAAEKNSRHAWWAAALHFRLAAIGYRQAGLGLLAKMQWLNRAECFDKIGNEEAAARCRREADVIPVYWEG